MTRAIIPAPVALDEADLRVALEAALGRSLNRRVAVESLHRRSSEFATLFPAEIVSLRLADGIEMSVFVKHLGVEESDHPEKQCRDREVRVYEALCDQPDLPVPRYYGSRWNDTTARHELFLEYVDGWNLKYHGLDRWVEAAHELGRLHAHFAGRRAELDRHAFLLRFDHAALLGVAHRALTSMNVGFPRLAPRLTRVVAHYERGADVIARQPVTLVHNDCSPKNVLADTSETPARICFIDWEMAGLGCGLVDLVHLGYGVDEETSANMLLEYCTALNGTDVVPSDAAEFQRLFAACQFERLLHRLWRSRYWKKSGDDVGVWVRNAEELAERF